MIKNISGLLSLLLCVLSGYSQSEIEGKVIDKTTKKPIVGVNVSVEGTLIKTVTNADGGFVLRSAPPAKLLLSHIGYKKETVLITQRAVRTFELLPSVNSLSEVVIVNRDQIASLFSQAENLLRKYNSKQYYGQAMYRHVVKIDDVNTEFQEIIYNTKLSNVKVVGTSVFQGRYAYKNNQWKFDSFSILTRALSFFNKKNQKNFPTKEQVNLKLVEIYSEKDQEIAVIHGFSKKTQKKTSEFYIDLNTKSLLKLKYYDAKVNFNQSPAQFEKCYNVYYDTEFTLSPAGSPEEVVLNSLKMDFQADLSTEHQPVRRITASSYVYFYNISEKPVPGVKYRKAKINDSDQKMIDKIPYDPSFWKNNPIVKRTVEEDNFIKDFERTNSFGRLLEE